MYQISCEQKSSSIPRTLVLYAINNNYPFNSLIKNAPVHLQFQYYSDVKLETVTISNKLGGTVRFDTLIFS